MLGKNTRYQWPSVLSFARNKREVEIERNAEFPARAEDRYANERGRASPRQLTGKGQRERG